MTLTLILLRHAKSGWDDPDLDDHARVLTDRGHRDARGVGTWLREHALRPGLILCSDASRTRETVAGVLDTLGQDPETRFLPELYHAQPGTMLTLIKKQTARTLLICAHNPGIGDLAQRVVTARPDDARFSSYPTAATTVVQHHTDDWADFTRGTCRLFYTPPR